MSASRRNGWGSRKVVSALIVVVLMPVAVAAAGASGGQSRTAERSPAQLYDPNSPGADPASYAHAKAEEDRAARRRAERSSPEQRDARRRSRAEFRGKGGRDPVDIARAKFKDAIAGPLYDPLPAATHQRVVKYLSGDAAQVEPAGGGPRSILASTAPLRAKDGRGNEAPVDLALESQGDAVAPANPVVPVKIDKHVRGGLSFPDAGVVMTLSGTSGDVAETTTDNRAFFANVATDTDLWATPTVAGAETFVQLRSAASPEALDFSFQLPAGSELRTVPAATPDAPAAVEVVRGAERLAVIAPPTAADATGEPVPVSVSVDHGTLKLGVSHRSKDLMYPILVDPSISFDWRGAGSSNDGWIPLTSNPNPGFRPINGNCYGVIGLCVYADANRSYSSGQYGDWYYPSIRSSYIYSFTAGSAYHTHPNYTCQRLGISLYTWLGNWGTSCGTSGPFNFTACADAGQCSQDAAPDGTAARMRLEKVATGTHTGLPAEIMQWATVLTSDRNNPTLDPGPGDTPWLGSDTTLSAHVAAHDAGLGIGWAGITTSATNLGTLPIYCNGTHRASCPADAVGDLSYSTNGFTEGDTTVWEYATDIVQHTAPNQAWHVKIDRTAPTFVINSAGSVHPGGIVGSGSQDLRIDANDNGAGGAQNSGVKHFRVSIDGQPASSADVDCGSGACSHTFPIDTGPTGLGAGDHTVAVSTGDGAGHWSDSNAPGQQQFRFSVDKAIPSVEYGGTLIPANAPWVPRGVERLSVGADDSGAGVKSIVLKVDGQVTDTSSQSCGASGCSLDHDFDVNTDNLAIGPHTIDVITTDAVNNSITKTWPLKLDRSDPAMSVTGALRQGADQTLTPGDNALTVSASDTGAGVKSIELFMDDAQLDYGEQTCDQGDCSYSRTYVFRTEEHPSGEHVFRVVTTDLSGNTAESTWTTTSPASAPAQCPPLPAPATAAPGLSVTPDIAKSMFQLVIPTIFDSSQSATYGSQVLQPTLAAGASPFTTAGTFADATVAPDVRLGTSTATGGLPQCAGLASIGGDATAGSLVGDAAALYANTAPASDTAVRPTATGTETFTQFRAAIAPTDVSWNVTLAPGQALKRFDDGTVAIVDPSPLGTSAPDSTETMPDQQPAPSVTDQQRAIVDTGTSLSQASAALERSYGQSADSVVTLIPTPWAQDALGRTVPTSFSVSGSTLTMHVDHGITQGTAYPLVAAWQQVSTDAVNRYEAAKSVAGTPTTYAQDDVQDVGDPMPPDYGVASGSPDRPLGPPTAADAATDLPTGTSDNSDATGDWGSSSSEYPDTGGDNQDRTTSAVAAGRYDPGARVRSIRVGVSDSFDTAFNGSAFKPGLFDTGVRRVRAIVPWNLARLPESDYHVQRFQRWYDAAKARNLDMLVTFEPTFVQKNGRDTFTPKAQPSTNNYTNAVVGFLTKDRTPTSTRWGAVHYIAAWNEPNYTNEKHPEQNSRLASRQGARRAATYWLGANFACHELKGIHHCPVVAGEFAGDPRSEHVTGAARYAAAYAGGLREFPEIRDHMPPFWSFHAHDDVQNSLFGNLSRSVTKQWYNAINSRANKHPAIWITEVGAPYKLECPALRGFAQAFCTPADKSGVIGMKQQRNATAFLFGTLPRDLPGIMSIYYFNMIHAAETASQSGKCAPGCPHRDRALLGANDDPYPPDSDAAPDRNPPAPGVPPDRSKSKGAEPGDRSGPSERRLAYCLVQRRETTGAGSVLAAPVHVRRSNCAP